MQKACWLSAFVYIVLLNFVYNNTQKQIRTLHNIIMKKEDLTNVIC